MQIVLKSNPILWEPNAGNLFIPNPAGWRGISQVPGKFDNSEGVELIDNESIFPKVEPRRETADERQ